MGREESQEGQVRQTAGLWNEGHFPEHVAEEDRVGSGRDSQAVCEDIRVSALCSPAGSFPSEAAGVPGITGIQFSQEHFTFLQQEGE